MDLIETAKSFAFVSKGIRIRFEKNEIIIHALGDNYAPTISGALLAIGRLEKHLKEKGVRFTAHSRHWNNGKTTDCVRIKIL